MALPQHVAIIMDGNGRWAQKRLLPRFVGHREGVKTFKRIVKHCTHRNIRVLTAYAFSTENWQRPADEVNYLMTLLVKTFGEEIDQLASEGVWIKMLGSRDSLPDGILNLWESAEERTKDNERLFLNVAFN